MSFAQVVPGPVYPNSAESWPKTPLIYSDSCHSLNKKLGDWEISVRIPSLVDRICFKLSLNLYTHSFSLDI